MQAVATRLQGPILLEPRAFRDERGFFQESFRASALAEHGISHPFVQDNHSRSTQGVLRGMHFQVGEGQAKLVRCARGAILDVVVDIRAGSPTFGQWEAHVLDDERHHQLYVPVGFGHGFAVLSDLADVTYLLSSLYDPLTESGIAWDDPDVGVDWQVEEPLLSERDKNGPKLAEVAETLPF